MIRDTSEEDNKTHSNNTPPPPLPEIKLTLNRNVNEQGVLYLFLLVLLMKPTIYNTFSLLCKPKAYLHNYYNIFKETYTLSCHNTCVPLSRRAQVLYLLFFKRIMFG